jgi:hypothetical protein
MRCDPSWTHAQRFCHDPLCERERSMAYDGSAFGREWEGRWCKACRGPIKADEAFTDIHFETEPEHSGSYHRACGRPFQSLARALNALSRRF